MGFPGLQRSANGHGSPHFSVPYGHVRFGRSVAANWTKCEERILYDILLEPTKITSTRITEDRLSKAWWGAIHWTADDADPRDEC